jgi:lysosomal acid lipase/cholesteryl ester hydrolase
MFPSVAFWQATLPTFILHAAMDFALVFLLGFQNHNISSVQKRASYTHIYCSSSVKTVVHWTQIMRDATFGLYQPIETAQTNVALMPKYATQGIKTPMVLIYGGRDSLVAIDTMRELLPPETRYHELPNYEHIDVLWGDDVENDVIPHVLSALNSSKA